MDTLTPEQTHKLRTLRYFLLDMDGTIYLGKNILPGAAQFVAYLRESGRPYLFFTNNPASDAEHYAHKLTTMGIAASPNDILTSGEATARYLAQETPYRKVFVIGTPSFESELTRAGLQLDEAEPEAVVLAFDKTLTYAKLEKANLLLRQGLPFIATNPDAVCPTDYGYIPDCGAIAALLQTASGRAPKYIGKPNPEMARMGMDKIGATVGDSAMVGDRLYTDMAMAYRTGITSILVLSGETTERDLVTAPRVPDFAFANVGKLCEALQTCDSKTGQK